MMDISDIDMLADLDSIDRDATTQYLEGLLQKAMEENKKLESQILNMKSLLKECSNVSSDSPSLEVVDSWKKIHCNKYVFGFHLKKCPESESLDVKNIILNWNSTFSPTYKIRIFQLDRQNNQRTVDEYPVESTIVKDESLALVVIPRPDFCHKLVFSVNAILLYAPASSEESQQIGLPVLEMDFKDIGDASFEVAYSDVLQRDTNSFLTCFVAREVFDLVAKIDHAENFETAISVKCGCEQIDLKSVKKLFWIRNTNVELEGNLIEVLQKEDNIFELKIIAQNEDILFQILHHLYKKIDGLCIVPKSHEIYLHHQGNSESNTQNFAEKLRKQLELFEEFHKNEIRRCSRANYLKFRAELDKLQLETDLLYLKCCNNE